MYRIKSCVLKIALTLLFAALQLILVKKNVKTIKTLL